MIKLAAFVGTNAAFKVYLQHLEDMDPILLCPICGRVLEVSIDRVGGRGFQTSLACPGRKSIDRFCGYGKVMTD